MSSSRCAKGSNFLLSFSFVSYTALALKIGGWKAEDRELKEERGMYGSGGWRGLADLG